MRYFKKTKKSSLYLWTVLLSIALLSAQGVKLHVHNINHDHDHSHHHDNSPVATQHTHLSIAHLSTDVSHIDHHDEVVSESDVSPDGLLIKVSAKTPFLALLVVLLSFVLFSISRNTFLRRHDDGVLSFRRCCPTPPLRAPPH